MPEGYKKLDTWKTSVTITLQWTFFYIVVLYLSFFIFSYPYYLISGNHLSFYSLFSSIFLVFIAIIPMLILHEGTHGIAALLVNGKPRYGLAMASGLPVAYTTFDEKIKRNNFIFISFAPLVGLSLVGMVLMFFLPPQFVSFLVLCLMYSTAGSVGDVWLVKQVLRYPKHVYIKDEKYGVDVFGKESDVSIQTTSKQIGSTQTASKSLLSKHPVLVFLVISIISFLASFLIGRFNLIK